MTLLIPPSLDQEDDEMLVPHTDFADGPQPMEVEQPDTASTVDAQTVEDPPSARFTWTIEYFSTLNSKKLYSDVFYAGGYKCFASVSAGATEAVLKIPESSQGDSNNIQKAEDSLKKPETALSSAVSATTSTTSIFSFGAPANNSNQNNGLVASSCSMFTSPSQLLGSNISNQSVSNSYTLSATTAVNASSSATDSTSSHSSSLFVSTAAVPSFSAAPIFAFGFSVAPSTSVSPVLTTSGGESTDKDVNTKQETTFGNPINAFFGGTSPATANTGNSILWLNGSTSNANSQSLGGTSSKISSTGSGIFGFSGTSSPATANNQTLGPITFGAGSGSLVSAQVSSPAVTGFASASQSMPTQFGFSASSSSFGVTGAAPHNSSNSLFGSSTPAKLFGPSSSGISTSVSLPKAGTSVSSTSGITSSVFRSNWQNTKSPIFGSTSTGFSFRRSSASVAGSNSAPIDFGSSTSASSAFLSSFNSSARTASSSSFPSSQPIFGNSNSVFAFGSTTGNHDQMNMEDSMAEDTVVQANTPPLPVLSQQSVITPSPSPAFMLGATATSGANRFQFGSQPSPATPQNPSPFQSSSSLDFNAGGSFSLGTGGGDKSNRRMVKVKHSRRKK